MAPKRKMPKNAQGNSNTATASNGQKQSRVSKTASSTRPKGRKSARAGANSSEWLDTIVVASRSASSGRRMTRSQNPDGSVVLLQSVLEHASRPRRSKTRQVVDDPPSVDNGGKSSSISSGFNSVDYPRHLADTYPASLAAVVHGSLDGDQRDNLMDTPLSPGTRAVGLKVRIKNVKNGDSAALKRAADASPPTKSTTKRLMNDCNMPSLKRLRSDGRAASSNRSARSQQNNDLHSEILEDYGQDCGDGDAGSAMADELSRTISQQEQKLTISEISSLFRGLQEKTLTFACQHFDHTLTRNQQTKWPLHELNTKYFRLKNVAERIADGSHDSWRAFFTRPENRVPLVQGILGEMFKERIFKRAAFSVDEDTAKSIEVIDSDSQDRTPFSVSALKAQALEKMLVSKHLEDDKRRLQNVSHRRNASSPTRKRERLDASSKLAGHIMTVLEPLLPPLLFPGYRNPSRLPRRKRMEVENCKESIFSDLLELICDAGALSVCIGLSGIDGTVIRFAPALPLGTIHLSTMPVLVINDAHVRLTRPLSKNTAKRRIKMTTWCGIEAVQLQHNATIHAHDARVPNAGRSAQAMRMKVGNFNNAAQSSSKLPQGTVDVTVHTICPANVFCEWDDRNDRAAQHPKQTLNDAITEARRARGLDLPTQTALLERAVENLTFGSGMLASLSFLAVGLRLAYLKAAGIENGGILPSIPSIPGIPSIRFDVHDTYEAARHFLHRHAHEILLHGPRVLEKLEGLRTRNQKADTRAGTGTHQAPPEPVPCVNGIVKTEGGVAQCVPTRPPARWERILRTLTETVPNAFLLRPPGGRNVTATTMKRS